MESQFSYCLGCFCPVNDQPLKLYKVQSESMKSIIQMDCLYLCNLCKRIAQKSEQFIQNVQSNHIFLENVKDITDTTYNRNRHKHQQIINLSTLLLHKIELNDNNDNEEESTSIIYSSNMKINNTVKLELKEEDTLGDLDDNFSDSNDCHESVIKDEDDCTLNIKGEYDCTLIIKDEDDCTLNIKSDACTLIVKDEHVSSLKKVETTKKIKKAVKYEENTVLENEDSKIKMIHITREQCLKERSERLQDPKYKNSIYKCEDCIQGFQFKDSYDKHMMIHSKAMGEFECDICKRRMQSMEKLLKHKRPHTLRYKCMECGLLRISRITIKDHYIAIHQNAFPYKCSQCNKLFKRQESLRRHIAYSHGKKKREKCSHCMKTYANVQVLRAHIMLKHAPQPTPTALAHTCAQCDVKFQTPSQLKYHMIKHSAQRDFYCVECDRGFKSNGALQDHLKRSAPHVNKLELPFKCLYCVKRFGVNRDLERHTNRFHLNKKPYQCEKCDKTYLTKWSLTVHNRYAHEGKKRPLKYPCPMCDKVFCTNTIRKCHIRTHTGEKPFLCTKCPAEFSQATSLSTHVKLVHLKLTRDGKPKQSPLSNK